MIKLYKIFLSSFLGGHCRFYPSCSDYAIEVIKNFPLHKAVFLVLYRIIRCNPFSKGGFDPPFQKGKTN